MKILRTLMYFLMIVLLTQSCKKEQTIENNAGNDNSPTTKSRDCSLKMSYDMDIVSYHEAADLSEQENLTKAEQVLALPKYQKSHVEICISKEGDLSAEITYLPSDNTIRYPENTLYNSAHGPDWDIRKIVIQNGLAYVHNVDDELVALETVGDGYNDQLMFTQIVENLQNAVTLQPNEVDIAMQGFAEAGFDMSSFNDRIEILTRTQDTGEKIKLLLDKKLGVIIGQATYTGGGKILQKSNYGYAGVQGDVAFTSYRSVIYVHSPLSGNKIAMIKKANITNFQKTIN